MSVRDIIKIIASTIETRTKIPVVFLIQKMNILSLNMMKINMLLWSIKTLGESVTAYLVVSNITPDASPTNY